MSAPDAAFFSQRNENGARARGVKRIAIPNRSTKSKQRKRLEKKRWFRNAQKWRTGCEGRISLLKRRHVLNRCRYKGMPGISAGSASASSLTTSSTSVTRSLLRPSADPSLRSPSHRRGRKAAPDIMRVCLRGGFHNLIFAPESV